MTSKKKKQHTYGGRKSKQSQQYNQQDWAVFEQNEMTEAGVLFHFTFLNRLPKICTVPNRRVLNEVWLNPELVKGFQERFVGTSLSEEVSLKYRIKLMLNIDVTTLGTKCQRALLLLETLLGNDLNYVNQFVEMNLATQIALIDTIVGLEAITGGMYIAQVNDYLFLQQCIENLHKLAQQVDVPIAEISLKPPQINDLMKLWQEHPVGFKTKEVFQKLIGFGLDSSTCCACLYAIADTTNLVDELLGDVYNSKTELETAYMVRKGSSNKKRWL